MISRRFAEAERRTGRAAEGARAAADQAIDPTYGRYPL